MLVPRRLPCSLDIHVATALSTSHTFTTHSELQAHLCTVCNGRPERPTNLPILPSACTSVSMKLNENLSVQIPGPELLNFVFPRGHDWPAVQVDASTDDSSSTAKIAEMNGSGGQLTLQSPFVESNFAKLQKRDGSLSQASHSTCSMPVRATCDIFHYS